MSPTLVLQRTSTNDQGTLGELHLPDGRILATLEPPWRDNARGASCLPPGVYPCAWHQSPRFGGVYRLGDTAPRHEVLIHVGNYAGDRALGYRSDSQGCVLVGLSAGTLLGPRGPQLAVLASRAAVEALAEALQRAPWTLEIRGHRP